jgi:hypothetical protein
MHRINLGLYPYLLLAGLSSGLGCASGGDGGALDDGESQSGAGGQSPVTGNGGSAADTSVPSEPQDDGEPPLDVARVVDFPAGVTVASPVSAGSTGMQPPPGGSPPPGAPPPNGGSPNALLGAGLRLLADTDALGDPSDESAYAASTASIGSVLSGEASLAARFDANAFFVSGGNAPCYGPSLLWQDHPDATGGDPSSGQLPGGDLGIWSASAPGGEACAAAQLNARMRSVQSQVDMGLTGLAGLVAAYRADGHTWPDDVSPGSSVDLTTAMASAGIEGVTFNRASMSLDATGAVWSYALDLDHGSGDAARHIVLELSHAVIDRDSGAFEGLLTYVLEDTYSDRNCGGQPSGDVSVNGSVHYIKSGADQLVLQARNASACGHASVLPAANLLAEPIESSVLSGNAVDPAGPWQDNFNVFTAELDPETLQGSYSYAWQAGVGDGQTRVLDVGLDTADAGEAYFGFGDRVQTSVSGEIRGFICNWAGPGNSHSGPDFARYAQRQFMTRDEATNRFVVADAAASDITYAPTNSCMYDGAGSFVYDRDLDNSLSDETTTTAGVMISGTSLAFDLMTVAEGEADIWEHIVNRGYDLPVYP